jgi:hypothetical protein
MFFEIFPKKLLSVPVENYFDTNVHITVLRQRLIKHQGLSIIQDQGCSKG